MSSTRYSCQILTKLEISKNTQIPIFMKIRPMGADLFMWTNRRTDGWMDRWIENGPTNGRTERQTEKDDEANNRFSQFRKRA